MAEKSDDFEIKLSDEDSPNEILVEPGKTDLIDDDQIGNESLDWLGESDLDDLFTESDELDREFDEEPLDLGMDEIGNLVEDLKMDVKEDETDVSVKGEKDMVFEEEETEEENSDSVESLLDELDSEENSGSDDSSVDDLVGDNDIASEAGKPELIDNAENSGENAEAKTELPETSEDGEPEVVDDIENSGESIEEEMEELDLSENMELSDDPDPEELTVSDPAEEAESAVESGESSEIEEDGAESSEVLEMLHDPEISEDSESKDTEELELGIDALDDTKDSELTGTDHEDIETDLVNIGESENEEIKFDAETEEDLGLDIESDALEEPVEIGEQMESHDSEEAKAETEKLPVIEKVESGMQNETEAAETSAVPLDADMLLNFHHEAVVEIARTQLTGEEITQITYGSIIKLDKVAGEPVSLVIDGKTIAHGEVILINNEKLGIRIIGIVQD